MRQKREENPKKLNQGSKIFKKKETLNIKGKT